MLQEYIFNENGVRVWMGGGWKVEEESSFDILHLQGKFKWMCLTIFFIHNQENLNVKDKKITTTPAAEELKSLFTPGNEFRFNATLELEKSESEATSSSSSEMEWSSPCLKPLFLHFFIDLGFDIRSSSKEIDATSILRHRNLYAYHSEELKFCLVTFRTRKNVQFSPNVNLT